MPNPDLGTDAWARASAVAALLLTLIGACWLFFALRGAKDGSAALPSAAFGALPMVLLAIRRMIDASRLPSSPEPEAAARRFRKMGMVFGTIFGIEGALIAVAAVWLAHIGSGALIVPAIVFIVGVHFLPLAYFFQVRVYYATGLLMLAWLAVCGLMAGPSSRASLLGIGTGLILWSTSALVLLLHTRGVSRTGV